MPTRRLLGMAVLAMFAGCSGRPAPDVEKGSPPSPAAEPQSSPATGAAATSQLTRGEAKRQLEAVHANDRDYEYLNTADDGSQQYLLVRRGQELRQIYPQYVALQDAGLALVDQVLDAPDESGAIRYKVRFTEKAMPFVEGIFPARGGECALFRCAKLLTGTVGSVEILGITTPGAGLGTIESLVEYRINWERTPVGAVLGEPQQLATLKQATFVKYDDGWRCPRC